MTIVERIKNLAKTKGQTLTSIERELGFSKSSIRKWEIQSPSVDKIIKVSNYLQVSIDYLITGKSSELTEQELELLRKWNELDATEQEVIQSQINTLIKVKEMKKGKLSS
jgi:transcriptional regulator with XRE-family HTH domain